MYEPSASQVIRNINSFAYHAPSKSQVTRFHTIWAASRDLADILTVNCPVSRELSSALSNLEQSAAWACAAITQEVSEG